MSELLPLLQKHHVLSEDEMERVSEEGLEQREQNRRLLEAIVSKPSFWVVKFAECLKENPKNRQLSELLLPQSGEWGINFIDHSYPCLPFIVHNVSIVTKWFF